MLVSGWFVMRLLRAVCGYDDFTDEELEYE
jgi:hypothetical protein